VSLVRHAESGSAVGEVETRRRAAEAAFTAWRREVDMRRRALQAERDALKKLMLQADRNVFDAAMAARVAGASSAPGGLTVYDDHIVYRGKRLPLGPDVDAVVDSAAGGELFLLIEGSDWAEVVS
jgi:hypothetical protein